MTRKPRTSPSLSSSGDEKEGESDGKNSDTAEQKQNIKKRRGRGKKDTNLDEGHDDLSEDEDENEKPVSSANKRSIPVKDKQKSTSCETSSSPTTSTKQDSHGWIIPVVIISIIIMIFLFLNQSSVSSSNDKDWRSKIDPNNTLSNNQQYIVRASLKPLLDKSSNEAEQGVSTLLILSPNEENAAKLARCLLGLVNSKTYKDQVPTEIDLQSHRGGKLKLDSNLKSLLNPGGAIRAVLLRHIDDNPSDDAFEQLRLLFAYCDGENPVIPHRLIIMTATSNSINENELREKFKTRWPKEHDFVDALMSRISGHTLYVETDQRSIC